MFQDNEDRSPWSNPMASPPELSPNETASGASTGSCPRRVPALAQEDRDAGLCAARLLRHVSRQSLKPHRCVPPCPPTLSGLSPGDTFAAETRGETLPPVPRLAGRSAGAPKTNPCPSQQVVLLSVSAGWSSTHISPGNLIKDVIWRQDSNVNKSSWQHAFLFLGIGQHGVL